MKKTARSLAAVALAATSLFALAPAAHANECQEVAEGSCVVQEKFCGYGSSLEQKYGVGWSCTQ